MTWNYRVVRKSDNWVSEYSLGIHEAYYEDDKVISITEYPVTVSGEDLIKVFAMMAEAFKKPVLDYSTLEEIENV